MKALIGKYQIRQGRNGNLFVMRKMFIHKNGKCKPAWLYSDGSGWSRYGAEPDAITYTPNRLHYPEQI